jgi:hypothetical protein
MTNLEIKTKAEAMKAKGCALSLDEIIAMYTKDEAKKAKKTAKRWAKIEQAETFTFEAKKDPSEWLAAKNRENAIGNLPSSMRK